MTTPLTNKELRPLFRAYQTDGDIEVPFVDLRRKNKPIVRCVMTRKDALGLAAAILKALQSGDES